MDGTGGLPGLLCPGAQQCDSRQQSSLLPRQDWQSRRQREDLRTLQGNGSPPSNVHSLLGEEGQWTFPVRHQVLESKSKEKPKAIPPLLEELLQGRTADERFTSLQGYCRLLSQQGVVRAMPVVTEEAQPPGKCTEERQGCFLHRCCWCHSHRQMVITGQLTGHVSGAALGRLILPACRTAVGLEEHSLSPRTVSEQVIPPGYLLTCFFELCKALPFPSRGGTPKWW